MLCNIGPVLFVNQYAGSSKTDRRTERTEGEAGPTVSWSNRHKERNSRLQHTEVRTPQEEEIMDRKCPDRTKELRCPPTSLRHCGKVRDWLLLYTSVG